MNLEMPIIFSLSCVHRLRLIVIRMNMYISPEICWAPSKMISIKDL